MVEILCPHCDEEIELDDDASGEFACPYCEGEFEWNTEPEVGMSNDHQSDYNSTQTTISPLQWVGHGLSFFILIFLIICLTSGSYYSISISETNQALGYEVVYMEMEYGMNSFSGMSLFEGEETSTYSERITVLEEQYNQYCADSSSDEMCALLEGEIDYYESWNLAGNILVFFLILALLCSIVVIASRMVLHLEHLEKIELQELMYNASIYGKRFLPFIIAGLLFIGMALFMLISPGAGIYEDLLALGAGRDSTALESGFGFIVWSSLLLPIIYSVFSFFEMDVA